jgi:hypothetical protein
MRQSTGAKSMLMKALLVGCAVIVSTLSAQATTYTYTGADHTVSISFCPFAQCGIFFPLTADEFQALAVETYGQRLTGSATFASDTSMVTGTFLTFDYSFTSGLVEIKPSSALSMSFVDGNVAAWSIPFSNVAPGSCGNFNIVCKSGGTVRLSSVSGDGISFLTACPDRVVRWGC